MFFHQSCGRKAVNNHADRLCKYLRRFDLEFSQITADKI